MLLLASTSPRRRQLLAAAAIPHEVVEPGDEPVEPGPPRQVVVERARAKALGARVIDHGAWVLGVDTVVDVDGTELGKPIDAGDASRMLALLSGREHLVHTGLCVVHPASGRIGVRVESARVACRVLGERELSGYLASELWRGKAGAYGLQDELCRDFLALVGGDPETVIGLPVAALRELLRDVGAEVAW